MATRKLPQLVLRSDSSSLIKLIKSPWSIIGVCFGLSIWASFAEPPAVEEARRQRRLRQKQEEQEQKMQLLTRRAELEKAAAQKETSSEQR